MGKCGIQDVKKKTKDIWKNIQHIETKENKKQTKNPTTGRKMIERKKTPKALKLNAKSLVAPLAGFAVGPLRWGWLFISTNASWSSHPSQFPQNWYKTWIYLNHMLCLKIPISKHKGHLDNGTHSSMTLKNKHDQFGHIVTTWDG